MNARLQSLKLHSYTLGGVGGDRGEGGGERIRAGRGGEAAARFGERDGIGEKDLFGDAQRGGGVGGLK